jgi:hypothetical protein
MKNKQESGIFEVRVVYGFKEKLKMVLLGEVKSGTVIEGMQVDITLNGVDNIGSWLIEEVLHMDFINNFENPNFKGLMLKCKNTEDFELLQALRIYQENVSVVSAPVVEPQ